MAKTSDKKREKIIVSMAGLAAVYLLVVLLFPGTSEQTQQAVELPDESVLATLTAEVDALANTPIDASSAILMQASRPWPEHAFVAQDGTEGDTVADGTFPASDEILTFSGYMAMEGGALAIVNNRDYQVGDTVEGFVLIQITPTAILLEKHGATVTVPLQTPEPL